MENQDFKVTFKIKEKEQKDQKIELQVQKQTTFKQLTSKFAAKLCIPTDKIEQFYSFYYDGYKYDINSNLPIEIKFRCNGVDIIYVEKNCQRKSVFSENKSMRDCLFLKNNFINNAPSSNMNNQTEDNKKEEVKDLLADMAVLGSLEKQIIQKELNDNSDKFVSINECLNSGDDQFFILGILAKYFEKIGIRPFIEVSNVTTNENEQIQANSLLQFICNGYILKHKYNLDFRFPPSRLEQIVKNINNEQNKFHNYLSMLLSRELKISPDTIIIRNYLKSKDLYSIIAVFKLNDKISRTNEEMLDFFHKQRHQDLKNLLDFKEEPIFELIRLNRSMLDKRGNNKSDLCWGFNETRGGENYYPPVGWWRYGLRVFGKYDNGNNDWLSYDNKPGEWCISYSGLSGMKKDISENYQNDKDIKHGKSVGMGVYVSPKPEIMEGNTEIINVNGVNYKMGLMLRVNPIKIRIPQSNNLIWVVDGISSEIRPYGILLKKIN